MEKDTGFECCLMLTSTALVKLAHLDEIRMVMESPTKMQTIVARA